jgi:hypothetical protein
LLDSALSWRSRITALQGAGSREGVPRHIQGLLAPVDGPVNIDQDTVTIAKGFLELHAQREQADYDHEAVFEHADTQAQIVLARQLVELAETARTDQAHQFFGLIAMQAQIRGRQP